MNALACVICGSELSLTSDLIECSCGARYPVLDGIPLLNADAQAYLEAAHEVLNQHLARLKRCDDLWAQRLSRRAALQVERVDRALACTPQANSKGTNWSRFVSMYVSETEFNERVRWAYGPYAQPLFEGHAEGLYASLFRLVAQNISDLKNAHVLEVGSGEGRNLLELSKVVRQVTGLDASLTQSHHSRAILCDNDVWPFFFRSAPTFADSYFLEGGIGPFKRDNIDFVTADATSLPFLANTFDAVAFTNVLNYTSCSAKAIAEARRVLKRDGVLIVGDLFTFSIHEKLDYVDPQRVLNNQQDLLRLLRAHELHVEEQFSASYLCRLAEGRDEIWREQFVIARLYER